MLKTTFKNLVSNLEQIKCETKGNSSTQLSSKEQETLVENKLVESGFSPLKKREKPCENGLYFIYQPYGSQKAPDFMLLSVLNNETKRVGLEVKRGKGKIMWNDGFPQDNTAYLFTDTKRCITKLLLKRHLILENMSQEVDKYEELCSTIKKLNLEMKRKNTCFTHYVRKASSQTITKEILEHKTRSDVIKFFMMELSCDFPK